MENNPYGIMALWNQGGWIIKFVALLLLVMSVASWTIIALRAWRAWKLYGLSKEIAAFWKAPTFAKGLESLKTVPDDNPFHALAAEGLQAASLHQAGEQNLQSKIGLPEWLTESLKIGRAHV